MNTHTEEQLARWVAERVEDYTANAKGVAREGHIYDRTKETWVTYAEYLSCKNVAGRLREWALGSSTLRINSLESLKYAAAFRLRSKAIHTFDKTVWDDTPDAILAQAEACGFVAHTQPTNPVDSQIPGDVDDNQENPER